MHHCDEDFGFRSSQDMLSHDWKISVVTLLLCLSLGISKIMLLVSVDSVASGLLSFHAGEQGVGCSVKNVAADKSMVVIFSSLLVRNGNSLIP